MKLQREKSGFMYECCAVDSQQTNSEKCQNPIFDSCQLFLDRCLQFEDIN